VDNTRGYARVSHSRQWSNYNLYFWDYYYLRDVYASDFMS